METVHTNAPCPRILIADGHEIFVEALRLYLEKKFTVIGAVGDGRAMLEEGIRLEPDVIVTDLAMPLLNGPGAAIRGRDKIPNAQFVFLTMHDDPKQRGSGLVCVEALFDHSRSRTTFCRENRTVSTSTVSLSAVSPNPGGFPSCGGRNIYSRNSSEGLKLHPIGFGAMRGRPPWMRPTVGRPRVILADNHPALLKATTELLKLEFEVVGNVTDGETLVAEALRLHPDVIVADIALPALSGIDAAHELRECEIRAEIVFLTTHSQQPFIEAYMAVRAPGYVLKSYMRAHLTGAIQAALGGQSYICPFVSTRCQKVAVNGAQVLPEL